MLKNMSLEGTATPVPLFHVFNETVIECIDMIIDDKDLIIDDNE